jgi:hypothetical protein
VRSSRPVALALLGPTLIVASLASLASPARADDSETFFAQGRTLRAQHKCAEAIVAFRRALDVKPQGLGSLRNVAECEEEIGEFASARGDWWSLRRAVLQSNEPKYEGWDKDAEKAYARLEPKVAHLTVKLTGFAPDRARVQIDGKPLDPRLVGVELERDLGLHTVEAVYGGAAPVTEKRSLGVGAHEVVTLNIPEPKAGDAPLGPPAGPGPAPATGGNKAMRAAGIAALTVGGLSVVGAVVSAAVRGAALSSFTCAGPSYTLCGPMTSDALSTVSRGQTASLLVNVFSVLAVAGVGAGIPLVVVGSRSGAAPSGSSDPPAPPSAANARAVIGLVPLFGGAAVHAGVSF